jgi:hypothetical protein
MRIIEIGLRLGQQRFLFLIRQLDQDRTLLHKVAVLEVDPALRYPSLSRTA